MRPRQVSPELLLLTDERMGERLWPALERLPRGAGVIVRHYAMPADERRRLFGRVRAVARRRGLIVLLAGTPRDAIAWRADGVHGRSPHRRSARPLVWSAPCHDRKELMAALRRDRSLRLVSPVFPTRSHPGARALGPVRLGLLLGRERDGIVALGGMDRTRARRLAPLGVHRWAAIDAWL